MAGGMRAQVARPHIQGLVTCSLSLASLSLSRLSRSPLSLSLLFLASLSLAPLSLSPLSLSRLSLTWSGRKILASSNVHRFRGGLVVKAHRLCVTLNSRLESKKEEEKKDLPTRRLELGLDAHLECRVQGLGSRV